jgi:hypothetical protein
MATMVAPGIMGRKTGTGAKAYDEDARTAGRKAQIAQE